MLKRYKTMNRTVLITLIAALLLGSNYLHAENNRLIQQVTLHLVGDSTMSDKPSLAYPERGWGQLLPEFMRPQLSVLNHAANGRSTRRFVNEGRWQHLLSNVNQGDYVLIQFGHNDSKQSDPARFADAATDYREFLTQFIADVRALGATPMLASSICRRNFKDKKTLQRDLVAYAEASREVAEQQQTSFFDLQQLSCDYWQTQGPAASQAYFIRVPADLYAKFPQGTTDNTHLNVQGATKVAQLFIRELQRQQHPLSQYVYRELL